MGEGGGGRGGTGRRDREEEGEPEREGEQCTHILVSVLLEWGWGREAKVPWPDRDSDMRSGIKCR